MKQFWIDLIEVNKNSIAFMCKYWVVYTVMCSVLGIGVGVYYLRKLHEKHKNEES